MFEEKRDPGEASRQFAEEVFPEELDYVQRRRQSVDDDRASLEGSPRPTVENDLVGLALSGGGIRSATFALGFMQALGRDRFRRVDFLSTVSGGGYIGSSVTARMANDFYQRGRCEFPFAETAGATECEALSHLRNNSDYLKPSGAGDLVRLVAILLRGIVLNSLALFPFLLLTCLLVLLVYGQQLSDRARFDDQIRQVDSLLGRYLGDRLDDQREVEPLLDVLEYQALLRIDEGKTRGDVMGELRSVLSFENGTIEGSDLISGDGHAQAPYRFTPSVTRLDLARALLQGDVLQRYEVIEEVDLLVRILEEDDYRHCKTPQGGVYVSNYCSADEGYYGSGTSRRDYRYEQREALTDALVSRDLIRPATDSDDLENFITKHWHPRLKVVLQALYNGEYLDEIQLGGLVRDALDRPAFYGYGWHKAHVGQRLGDGWTPNLNAFFAGRRFPAAMVRELGLLAESFPGACFTGLEHERPPCVRTGTTPGDVTRLLEFELANPSKTPESQWAAIRDWAISLEEKDAFEVLGALYIGEYLDQAWVVEALKSSHPETEAMRLAKIVDRPSSPLVEDGRGKSHLITDRLVLGREVLCRDLTRMLYDNHLVWDLDCPRLPGDLEKIDYWLEALWPRLDQEWIARQLYFYRYGWHRNVMGDASISSWCAASAAGASDPACPEVSHRAWADISRARKDPSRWDPQRLRFPLTAFLARAALGWVFFTPLLLLAARALYRRRQRVIGEASDPFVALDSSSDRSLVWRKLYDRSFGLLLAAIFALVLFELLPYAVHHFHYLNESGQAWWALALGALSFLLTGFGGPALLFLKRFGRWLALITVSIAGPLLLLIIFVLVMELVVYQPPPQIDAALEFVAPSAMTSPDGQPLALWYEEAGQRRLDWAAAWLLFALVGLISMGLARLIDINSTALHGYYRDRIARAFMVGLDTEGDIEPEEDLPLHQICPDGSGAPYHVLNVAMNLPGCKDRSLRGRAADFFFFSRHHIGGPRTGYCRTADMAKVFPEMHLASAMAVSGAAVSPVMGRFKSGPLAVLIGLLNARLALWIPHPRLVRQGHAGGLISRAWRRLRLATPATLLLRELAGLAHDRGGVINVSDGGHIENMGAIELLRRRCREIVVVDGEADPEMSFGGFALLQRIARIDLGIEIDIDLDGLRPDEKGLSRSRAVTGVIRYPTQDRHNQPETDDDPPTGARPEEAENREIGRLLYVKLAVTGREGGTIAAYRAEFPDFPHQSTGDQFFDEGQFEAYRRLGQLAGQDAFTRQGEER